MYVAALQSHEMLTVDIVWQFISILKSQFPAIMGLSQPIPREEDLTRWPKFQEDHTSYEHCNSNLPYIQIVNTGHDHWITCYKAKGKA